MLLVYFTIGVLNNAPLNLIPFNAALKILY